MNFKKILIVYRKEMLEVFRDRRMIFTTFVLPLILYPLLFIGFSSIMGRQTQVLEERGADIAIADSANTDVSRDVIEKIKENQGFTLLPLNKETDNLFEQGELQAAIVIVDSTTDKGSQVYKVKVRYDSSKERNQLIYGKIKDSVAKATEQSISRELTRHKIDPAITELISVSPFDTATAQKKIGSFLGSFLPYIMIMLLTAGASAVAGDLIAGEKERKTLETLLVSSAQRNELVMGKYLTIITVAMANVIVNLFSMGFSMQYMIGSEGMASSFSQMPVMGFLILLAAMIPLATLFAALMMSISTFSRNLKEAGSYQQPVMLIAMLLGMVSFLPSIEISDLLAMVPVINIALLFKAVLMNEYQISHLLITIASTLLLDVFAIWGTIRLFNSESTLFRTDEGGSLKHVRKEKKNLFNGINGLIIFALALALMYYLGSYLQGKDLIKGMLQTQILIILLPPILILRILKLKPNEMLRIKAPSKEILTIPFIAISAMMLVGLIVQLINVIYPFPEYYTQQLEGLFKNSYSIWVLLGVIALAPGICEEIMFRGFLMRFYEANGKKAAVLISALLFAVFHLDPFRLLPTFLLGILLGYLTLRSGSIVNSMISHAVNNSLAIIIDTFAASVWLKPLMMGKDGFQWWLAAPAAVILVLSLWAFHRLTAVQNEESSADGIVTGSQSRFY